VATGDMMAWARSAAVLLAGGVVIANGEAIAQQAGTEQAAPPAAAGTAPAVPATAPPAAQLPDVEIIQKKQAETPPAAEPAAKKPAPPKVVAEPKPKPKPKPVAKKAAPAPAPAAAPQPVEEVAAEPEPVIQGANPVYGAQNSQGAAARANVSAQAPVNSTSIVPQDLSKYSGSASVVSQDSLTEAQPRNINEAFARVPGVIIINDDGAGHHGGIALRGSPARRSRKVLVMEDGHPVNLALWLDPSVHFFAPADRIEAIEVVRGTTITHGPNNNFGTINVRNLSPFGPNETVVSSAIGVTKNKTGFFVNEDGDKVRGSSDNDVGAKWHVHTRQGSGNFGAVISYTGEDVQGAWDTERLAFNDFYGAFGWKGTDQDLVVSFSYTRQRDKYDETNLEGEDDDDNGEVEANFFRLGHCKTCFAPGAGLNNYNGDIVRGQLTHNVFVDDDTTVTTHLYAGRHVRNRYQIITPEDNPLDADQKGIEAEFEEGDDDLFNVLVGQDSMFGRLRSFRHVGAEVRTEFANRPFMAGMTQDIQVGLRYEYQDMTNRNFIGLSGQALSDGDETGLTIFDRSLSANTVSAFMQTSIKATSDFSVTPGIRFEWYNIDRVSRVTAEEEGEAVEITGAECAEIGVRPDGGDPAECLEIEGINRRAFNDSTDSFNALPGISFAYTGFNRTTVFAGYHRGLSTAVLRNEDFPSPDEIGDNFELGLRSTAVKGVSFEVTGFHQRLHDFQFGSSFSAAGDRSFGRADEVQINGVELLGRLNSQPFTGGAYNVFGEANYTYARSRIEEGFAEDGDGNRVSFAGRDLPEVPFHVAALTVGVQGRANWHWDASATYTYRGSFFTDEFNTPFGGDPEGENGEVPDIWLLSARFNLDIGTTGASVFVAGDNLTDELYISDREDGLKPGIGRTFWTGFKYKF